MNNVHDPAVWHKTFKEVFCESFRCRPEQFERKLFWRCLYRHALPLAVILWWIKPAVFGEDFELIREVGAVDDPDLFQRELEYFHGRNVRDKRWLRGVLRVRVSGKRLLKIKRKTIRR